MSSSKPRDSIKSTSNKAWKEKLRKECFDRLDAARSQLLTAARNSRSQVNGLDANVQTALRTIISDSSAHLQHTSPLVDKSTTKTSPPTSSSSKRKKENDLSSSDDDDDEEDFQIRRLKSPKTTTEYIPSNEPPEFSNLTPEEYMSLMESLEASLYEDLLREEADYLDSLEQQELDSMVEAHFGRMGLESQKEDGDGDEDSRVLCPICEDSYLIQRKGVILCPKHRDLRLDGAIEGLNLSNLRERLAAVLEEHAVGRNCTGRAIFEQTGVPGMHSLLMKCETCGALEVVL